jgi:dUTP pyrophosphatase
MLLNENSRLSKPPLDITIKVRQLPEATDLPLPKYMTQESAGMDLRAAVSEPTMINPGEIKLISTGIQVSIPKGFEGQVRPRSGLAAEFGVTVLNSPGTIDSDYRGEIKVILINHGAQPFKIERGDRIAQLVVNKVERAFVIRVHKLDESKRDEGGFGHTGTK